MPSLNTICHEAAIDKMIRKLPERDRPLTPEKQAIVVANFKVALKAISQCSRSHPAWLRRLIGAAGYRGAAIEGVIVGVNTHKKTKGVLSSHIYSKTRGALSGEVKRTLAQCGGRPDRNGRIQQNTVSSLPKFPVIPSKNGNHACLDATMGMMQIVDLLTDIDMKIVLVLRYGYNLTFPKIGDLIYVSREHARNLHDEALQILAGSEAIKREYELRIAD